MKKIKLLLFGIVSILGIGLSFADFTVSGQLYEDGFYRNQSLGLITFIQGENIATFQDKNVGATQVYDGTQTSFGTTFSGGTMESWGIYYPVEYSLCSQIGNLFQFGNNYAFDCSTVFNSGYNLSTMQDLQDNYSRNSNPLYLNGLYNPSTLDYNDIDIWGGDTGTPESQQNICSDGYYIPNSNDIDNFYSMLVGYFGGAGSDLFNGSIKLLSYYLKYPIIKVDYSSYDPSWTYEGFINSLGSSLSQHYNGIFYNSILGFRNYGFDDNKVGYIRQDQYNIYYFYPFAKYDGPGDFSYPATRPYLTPVRCFKSTPVLPNRGWITLTGGDTSVLPPDPDDGNGSTDITTPIIPVDGSPYDIMGLYIRQYVLCKMTSGHLYSGAVGSCDGFQWEEFFQGHSTMIYDNGSSIRMSIYSGDWFLSNYCSSISNSFMVPFCSQLDLYQDAQVDYILYKDDWSLRMFILGSGFNLEASFSSGGLISTQCFGVWCPDYVFTGDFQFIPETGHNDNAFSGFLVDDSFYNLNNGNRLFFNCPYPYSGSYLVIAQDLISNLGGVDILKPINCFISAFSYGDQTMFFGNVDQQTTYWSGSLFRGDSYSSKVLFSFFDIILSIGIFYILVKLFKL